MRFSYQMFQLAECDMSLPSAIQENTEKYRYEFKTSEPISHYRVPRNEPEPELFGSKASDDAVIL
jgi:hypothetical protein